LAILSIFTMYIQTILASLALFTVPSSAFMGTQQHSFARKSATLNVETSNGAPIDTGLQAAIRREVGSLGMRFEYLEDERSVFS
jgi:hypothetical protein